MDKKIKDIKISVEIGCSFLRAAIYDSGDIRTLSMPVNGNIEATFTEVINRAVSLDHHFDLTIVPSPETLEKIASEKDPVAILVTEGFEAITSVALSGLLDSGNVTETVRIIPVRERTKADGTVDYRPDIVDLSAITSELKLGGIKHVAVCLLHSCTNPLNETFIGDFLGKRGYKVYLSCDQVPIGDEIDRIRQTSLAASMGASSLLTLSLLGNTPMCRQRSFATAQGASMPYEHLDRYPIEALADPAWLAARYAQLVAESARVEKAVFFQMNANRVDLADESSMTENRFSLVNGKHCIGKIASLPLGGYASLISNGYDLYDLRTNYLSRQKPACFGEDNRATLVDAYLYLGYIPANEMMSGMIKPDLQRCNRIIEKEAEEKGFNPLHYAEYFISLAETSLEEGIRKVLRGGREPRPDTTLCSYGCYAGLLACSLADSAGIRSILVPASAGAMASAEALSATPGLSIKRQVHMNATDMEDDSLAVTLKDMLDSAKTELATHGISEEHVISERLVTLRTRHSSASVQLPYSENIIGHFQQVWRDQFCSDISQEEIVAISLEARLRVFGSRNDPVTKEIEDHALKCKEAGIITNGKQRQVMFYNRTDLNPGATITGPALVYALDYYVFVAEEWQCRVDKFNNLRLVRG